MKQSTTSNIVATLADIAEADIVAPTTLNGLPGMSSLEISGITGKRHDHVLRDIRRMLAELGEGVSPNLGAPQFVEAQYRDVQGKVQPLTVLDKELTFTLLARYSFKLANLIVKRWLELEGSGFERVSVQEAVVHLKEREKDIRSEALHRIRKSPSRSRTSKKRTAARSVRERY